ncbi:MAG: DNA primase [Treponema phagedenis]|uniref:DNA primase n=1 Tax=Treponema phagedenis TaxID=162 RepID=UPI003133FD13
MAKITAQTIDAVNDKTDLVSLVENYTHLERRGHDWWGCCPFHNEKTPSFHVVPDKKMYYCFGCGSGGSTIKFLMEMEKIPFAEAVERLAKRAGIPVEYEGGGYQPSEDSVFRDQLLELYDRITKTFHHFLMHTEQGKPALDYLKSRAVSDSVIESFKLGFAPEQRYWLFKFLTKKGYSAEFLARSGLFARKNPESSFFAGRIIYPITNRHGQVIAFGGRILSGNGPKYLNTADIPQYKKGENLFAFYQALPEIRKTKSAIICEGYMDVMAFHQAEIQTAIAPLGTALTEEQVHLIHSFADTVYLCFDSDTAGQAATYKAIKLCRTSGLDVRVLNIQKGKDPADILLNEGNDGLKTLLKNAILDSNYLMKIASNTYDLGTPEGKHNAAAFLFPYIEVLESDIQRESTINKAASAFGISQRALYADYQNRNQATPSPVTQPKQRASVGIKRSAELRVVLAVVANPELFKKLRYSLTADHFEDELAKDLFIVLEECYRADADTYDSLFSRCQNEELKNLISETIISGEFSQNAEKIVDDGIRFIKRNILFKRKDAIVGRLRQLSGKPHAEELEQLVALMSEKQRIDDELQALKEKA